MAAPQIEDPNELPLRSVMVMCAQAYVVVRVLTKAGAKAEAKTLAKAIGDVSDGVVGVQVLLDAVDAAMKIVNARQLKVDVNAVNRVTRAAEIAMNVVEEWTNLVLRTIRSEVHKELGRKTA